jgi:hypothetical protein
MAAECATDSCIPDHVIQTMIDLLCFSSVYWASSPCAGNIVQLQWEGGGGCLSGGGGTHSTDWEQYEVMAADAIIELLPSGPASAFYHHQMSFHVNKYLQS